MSLRIVHPRTLFPGLDAHEARWCMSHVTVTTLAAGERFHAPALAPFEYCVLAEGSLEVTARGADGVMHPVATYSSPYVFAPRAGVHGAETEVHAPEGATVHRLSLDALRRACERERTMAHVFAVVARDLFALRDRQDAELAQMHQEALRSKIRTHRFVVNLLSIVCLYTFTLWAWPLLSRHIPSSTAWVSVPLQAVFLLGSLHFVRHSGHALRAFGIVREGAMASVRAALVITVPLALAMVGVKWLALTLAAPESGWSLFDAGTMIRAWGVSAYGLYVLVYMAFVLVQEFVVRGAVETGFRMVLHGRGRMVTAALLSNVLFGLTHLHLSLPIALGAFTIGLFWSALFARQKNLAGVVASHAALGTFAFFVLGIGSQ